MADTPFSNTYVTTLSQGYRLAVPAVSNREVWVVPRFCNALGPGRCVSAVFVYLGLFVCSYLFLFVFICFYLFLFVLKIVWNSFGNLLEGLLFLFVFICFYLFLFVLKIVWNCFGNLLEGLLFLFVLFVFICFYLF